MTFEQMKLGDPMLETTNIGPLANGEQPEYLKEIVDDAISLGASVVVGGNMNSDEHGKGRFFEPTVIA